MCVCALARERERIYNKHMVEFTHRLSHMYKTNNILID